MSKLKIKQIEWRCLRCRETFRESVDVEILSAHLHRGRHLHQCTKDWPVRGVCEVIGVEAEEVEDE